MVPSPRRCRWSVYAAAVLGTVGALAGPARPALAAPSVTGADAQSETINVTIPNVEGMFMLTVEDPPAPLSIARLSTDNATFESTGSLGAVTVKDGRSQSRPGWSISGQVSDFGDGTDTLPGNDLGWAPRVTTPNAGHDVLEHG